MQRQGFPAHHRTESDDLPLCPYRSKTVRKTYRPPRSSDYIAAEAQGQQSFDLVPERPEPKRTSGRSALPLLHGRRYDELLAESPNGSLSPSPTNALPSKQEPFLPFSRDELNIQHATAMLWLPLGLSCALTILILAVVIFQADISEVGAASLKLTGVGRHVLLGFAGIGAIVLGALVVPLAFTASRRVVWALTKSVPPRPVRWIAVTLMVLLLELPSAMSLLFTHQHAWSVARDIHQSVLNEFTMPKDWTPTMPPPPLPIRKPKK